MLYMYAVYDRAAKGYSRPIFFENHSLALRAFEHQIQTDTSSFLHSHPEQFSLYCIGEYDEVTGEVVARSPEPLAVGHELVPDVPETLKSAGGTE